MLVKILEILKSFSINYLPKIIGSVFIVIIGFLLAKLLRSIVKKHLNRTSLDQSLASFIITLVSICVKVVIILTALANLGVSITGLVAAFSAGAVAVALALKDSLSNIAAGIVMLISQPFSTGDYIDVDGCVSGGKVLKIDIVHTTLLTPDNRRIVIPNGQLVNKTVVDYSKEETRRLELKFGIGYDNDVKKAKEIISRVIAANEFSLEDPSPFVRVSEHSDSAVIITIRVWCKAENYWSLHFDLLEQIKEEFDKNDITIPFNQLDVHIVNNDK